MTVHKNIEGPSLEYFPRNGAKAKNGQQGRPLKTKLVIVNSNTVFMSAGRGGEGREVNKSPQIRYAILI
jgi:hypothetical protein